jgi:5-methylcytosine-specific restriction endonuclease McrA
LFRGRISRAMKLQLSEKAYKTIDLLGCSIECARNHIESQFNNEMNWNNHGILWEIDHIIPINFFDLTNKEEQKKAFHYKNLQPLNKMENRTKGSKLPQDNDIVRTYRKL